MTEATKATTEPETDPKATKTKRQRADWQRKHRTHTHTPGYHDRALGAPELLRR